MRFRSGEHSWLTVLIQGLTSISALPAQSQARRYTLGLGATPVFPRPDFRYRPRWVGVPDTHVLIVWGLQRPAYDLFCVESGYYIYDDGSWYHSSRWDGVFTAIHPRSLPAELHHVPRQYWRNYPADWASRSHTYSYAG